MAALENFSEDEENRVALRDISHGTFHELLYWIYAHEVAKWMG